MIVEPSLGAQALRAGLQAAEPLLPLPAVGSTLQLSVLSRDQLGVRVATEQGLTLLLPGQVAAGLPPGAQLLLRVVATEPRLQLMTLPAPEQAVAPQSVATRQLPAAAEQARLHGWHAEKPAADTLAAGWRGVLQAAASTPAAEGTPLLPAMLLAGVRPDNDPLALARRLAEQGWQLAHCWPGQTLRLAVADDEQGETLAAAGGSLLLQLQLPFWGEVLLRVWPSSAGLLLQLQSASAAVVAQWQARLAHWQRRLLAAGFSLQLQMRHAPFDKLRPALPGRRSVPAPAQFQLAAQMILLLQAAAEDELAAEAAQSAESSHS
ncbi:hypothetical protein [Vogesella oryzae]|uniref:hypothetical protein n=1 Tax=Vogesella oryzae TaxID=1735285 RepID=UPI0015816E00|nr:hypothetical protein [Vogesella oryzae]